MPSQREESPQEDVRNALQLLLTPEDATKSTVLYDRRDVDAIVARLRAAIEKLEAR